MATMNVSKVLKHLPANEVTLEWKIDQVSKLNKEWLLKDELIHIIPVSKPCKHY